jgi:hypothetical protein
MTDIVAESAKKTAQKASARKTSGDVLHRRYREIGIPAVAAAARYQGAAKNPAYAPVMAKWDGGGDVA